VKKQLNVFSVSLVAVAFLVVASACSSTPAGSTTADKATPAQAEVNPTPAKEEANSTETAGGNDDSSNANVKIDSTKLLKDNGSGTAGDEVQSFKASDHKEYFDMQLSDFLKTGSNVKFVLTAVDTTAGKNINITEVNTKVVVGNKLTANLSMDKDFPVGSYKVDVTVNGKPLGSIDYTVTE
jgi:hypothetical protein